MATKFTWKPDPARVRRSVQFNTLVTRFENGREQRRAKGSSRLIWNVRFRKDEVDAGDIWDFYVARQGAFESFEFDCPWDDKMYTVRFGEDQMDFTVLWDCVYEAGLDLYEVVDP